MISPWLTTPADLQPPLQADVNADVVIVGAGYTGLSTALALQRAGVHAVVVESDFAGFGASGRNAGHLAPTIGKDLPTLLMLFGKARAARLVRFAEHAVAHVEETLRNFGIDCDYEPTGNIMAAVHPSQEKRLRNAALAAGAVGARVRFLDGAAMRDRGLPKSFLAGAWEEVGGTLDPGKYVSALRQRVLAAGIKLYEQTPVQEIHQGPSLRVRTPGGVVTADKLVLATNAYTLGLGHLRSKIYPLHDTLVETEPLTAEQRSRIDWNGREGIYTAHESLENYRLTARGTIVGGSKGVRYPYGGVLGGETTEHTRSVIERAFRDRFPELSDLAIQHHWGGWIAMTLHFLPALGVTGSHRNIYYSVGYNGHGLAAASAMGPLLADFMLGRCNDTLADFLRFVPPMPPEPLRWLMIRGMLGVLNAADARVDRKVRAKRGAITSET